MPKSLEVDQNCRECPGNRDNGGRCAGQLHGHWYSRLCPDSVDYVGLIE